MNFGVQPAGTNQVVDSAYNSDMRLKFSHDCRCSEACKNDLKIFRPDAGWQDVQLTSMCRQPLSIYIVNSTEQVVNTSAVATLYLMDHGLMEDIKEPCNISKLEGALVPFGTCNKCSKNLNLQDRKQSCGIPQCTGGGPFFAMADGQGTPKVKLQLTIQEGSIELRNLYLVKCGESTKKVQLIARKMCLVALLQKENGSPLVWATSQPFKVASNRSKSKKDKQVLELVDRKIGKRQRRKHNNKNRHTPTEVFFPEFVPMKKSTIFGQKNHPYQHKNWQQALEEAMNSQLEQHDNNAFNNYSDMHCMQSDMYNMQSDIHNDMHNKLSDMRNIQNDVNNTCYDAQQQQQQFKQNLKIDNFNNCYNGYNLQYNINNMSQKQQLLLKKQCQQGTTPTSTPNNSSNCSSNNFDRNNENNLQREVNIVIHQNLKQNKNYEQVQNIACKNIFGGSAEQFNKFTDDDIQLQKYKLQTQDFSKYVQQSVGKNLNNINQYYKRSFQHWKQIHYKKKLFRGFGCKKLHQHAKNHEFQSLHPSLVNYNNSSNNQARGQFAKWGGDMHQMHKMLPPVTSGDPAQAENFMSTRMSIQGQQPLTQLPQQLYRQQVPRSIQEQATTNIFDKSTRYIPKQMLQTQHLNDYNNLMQPKHKNTINGSKYQGYFEESTIQKQFQQQMQVPVQGPKSQFENNCHVGSSYHQSNQYINLQSTQRTRSQPSPLLPPTPNSKNPKMIKIEGTVISQRIQNTQPLRAHSFDLHDMEYKDEKFEKQGLPRLEQCLQKREQIIYQQRLQKHSNLNNAQKQISIMENNKDVSDEFRGCMEVSDEVLFKWQDMKNGIKDVNMLFSSMELKDGNEILENLKNQQNLRNDLDFSVPELDLGDF